MEIKTYSHLGFHKGGKKIERKIREEKVKGVLCSSEEGRQILKNRKQKKGKTNVEDRPKPNGWN